MKRLATFLSLFVFCFVLGAQEKQERRWIDLDRANIPFASQQALEKSREYIRKDSTYYIGYMYWGAYLFNRANDEQGFKLAAVILQKACNLIERDYDKQLRTRSNDLMIYLTVNAVQNDYGYITNWLEGAYQNIEQADKAFEVLASFKDHDLQYEGSTDSWNTMAWIYHRNRMYTSEKFPFLKNSVYENDSMAYDCLDSAIAKTDRDIEMNQGLFDPTFMASRYYYTYHYKVILFTYDFQLDSADYYYEQLLSTGYYSSNNYANYQYMKGEFPLAEQFYKEAETRDATTDKHTREYFYMRGLLEIYRGSPANADSLLKHIIDKEGFTPGYGWHTIALARALTYEGLTAVSQRKVNNAARFEELHIGTTWGQEQYNLGVAMLNYLNQLHFEAEHYFQHDEWYFWLNPVNWYAYLEYKIKVHHFRLVLVSMVAANPERAEVLYPLFASENIMGWDENWQMLDGFSNQYFIRYYEELLDKDPRIGVKNYIRFMLARLHISEDEKETAKDYLNQIIYVEDGYWTPFDRLLQARTCEALALCSDDEVEQQAWLTKSYMLYPQLVPFGEQKLDFNVSVDGAAFLPGAEDTLYRVALFGMITIVLLAALYFWARKYFKFRHKSQWVLVGSSALFLVALCTWLYGILGQDKLSDREIVLENFSNCKIGFVNNPNAPMVKIAFVQTDSIAQVTYEVICNNDTTIAEGAVSIDPARPYQTGKLLAYRLFNIKYVFESEEVEAEEIQPDSTNVSLKEPGS